MKVWFLTFLMSHHHFWLFKRGHFNKTLSTLNAVLGGNGTNISCTKNGVNYQGRKSLLFKCPKLLLLLTHSFIASHQSRKKSVFRFAINYPFFMNYNFDSRSPRHPEGLFPRYRVRLHHGDVSAPDDQDQGLQPVRQVPDQRDRQLHQTWEIIGSVLQLFCCSEQN